ncbi:MAG: lipoprotein [Magnetococcales bacterium]|nr:lipoprotein [Magnetococcales bacterium]
MTLYSRRSANRCATVTVWLLIMTLTLSACGLKGDLYMPGTEEKKGKHATSSQKL